MKEILLKALIFLAVFKKGNAFLRMERAKCTSIDNTFCTVALCEVKPNKAKIPAFSMTLNLLQGPITNCRMNIQFRHVTQLTDLILLNKTFDFCEFMKNPRKYPAVANSISGLLKCTDFNHTCPLNQLNFSLKGYVPEKLTLLAPTGTYLMKTTIATDGKNRIAVENYLKVG